ncbi:MAG: DUF2974 domain-containing protein [Sphingopyxis sp.]|nr:DUF2974 domain-containing protein [Sphingopyxis sp.]
MTSNALMNAVLSMDSYNRFHNISLKVASTQIGNYTLQNIVLPSGYIENSFVAAAYSASDGSTIVSYRGTDANADISDWGIGIGTPFSYQFLAALDFYNSVVDAGSNPAFNIDPDAISLTGHSLGGGLAGIVAAFHGINAEIFANMPFELSVENAYSYIQAFDQPFDPDNDYSVDIYSDPELYDTVLNAKSLIFGNSSPWSPLISNNIHGFAIDSEFLENLRHLQSTTVEKLDIGTSPIDPLDPIDIFERHNMAMHTLLLWEQGNNYSGWEEVAPILWETYNDNDIGAAIGFIKENNIVLGTGVDESGDQMATAIAYSVIDEGVRPFGDTAVDAFFGDASDLGTLVASDLAEYIHPELQQNITTAFVQYAGLLAKHAIQNSSIYEQGILTLHEDNMSFSINLSVEKWAFNSTNFTPLGRDDLVNSIATQFVSQSEFNDALSWYTTTNQSIFSGTNLIGSVNLVLQEIGNAPAPALDVAAGQIDMIVALAGHGADAADRGNSDDLLLGSGWNEALLGREGSDILLGGQGNDQLFGGSGDDYLLGSDGNDVLIEETGNNVLIGGAGNDVIIGGFDDNVIDAGAGNDIITVMGHGTISTGAGEDLVWLQVFDEDYRQIVLTDGGISDSIVWNGHALNGADWVVIEEETLSITEGGSTWEWSISKAAHLDEHGIIYDWEDGWDVLTVFLPDKSEIRIEDFSSGDYGIYLEAGTEQAAIANSSTPRGYFANDASVVGPDGNIPNLGEEGITPEIDYIDVQWFYLNNTVLPESIYALNNPGNITIPLTLAEWLV